MCNKCKPTGARRMDKCMIGLATNLNHFFKEKFRLCYKGYKVVASCCGHGKYPPSVIIQWGVEDYYVELFSSISIPRKRNFYKKDEDGYYYLPEVSKEKKLRRNGKYI